MRPNNSQKKNLRIAIAMTLVLLLTFGGFIQIFAVEGVSQESTETVTQVVYEPNGGGSNDNDLNQWVFEERWDGRGTDSLQCGKAGEGERPENGDGWIHWVFSTKGTSTDAQLELGGSGSGTYSPGEPFEANVWHFYTPYFELDGLTAEIFLIGAAGQGGGLVISDFCPGQREDDPEEPEFELIINKVLLDAGGAVIEEDEYLFTVEVEMEIDEVEVVLMEEADETMSVSVDAPLEVKNLKAGTYTVRELLSEEEQEEFTLLGYEVNDGTRGEDAVVTFSDSDEVRTQTVTIVNQLIDDEDPADDPEEPADDPEDPADDPGDDPVPADEPDDDPVITADDPDTPLAAAEVVEVQETVIPESVQEVEDMIVLDEPIPLAPPVLPQTGERNPLFISLAGLFLMAVGFIFRKRIMV